MPAYLVCSNAVENLPPQGSPGLSDGTEGNVVGLNEGWSVDYEGSEVRRGRCLGTRLSVVFSSLLECSLRLLKRCWLRRFLVMLSTVLRHCRRLWDLLCAAVKLKGSGGVSVCGLKTRSRD